MKRIRRCWRAWVAIIDRCEAGDALALMRIAMGLAVVQTMVTTVWAGVVPVLWYDVADGGMVLVRHESWLVELLGGATPALVWTLVVLSLVGGLCVTVGLGGRIAPLVTAQAMLALRGIYASQGAYGAIIANGLWLLVLADATRTLSLDCRLRTGRWTDDTPVPAWPKLVGVIQLALIYFSAGVHKLSATWLPGGDMSALYYILQQPNWQRYEMSWIASVYPLTQIGTVLTWFLEIAWPVLLVAALYRAPARRERLLGRFFSRFDPRKLFMPLGIVLHLGVAIAMDVGPFFLATIAFYPCYFASTELRAMGARLAKVAIKHRGSSGLPDER